MRPTRYVTVWVRRISLTPSTNFFISPISVDTNAKTFPQLISRLKFKRLFTRKYKSLLRVKSNQSICVISGYSVKTQDYYSFQKKLVLKKKSKPLGKYINETHTCLHNHEIFDTNITTIYKFILFLTICFYI